MRLWQLQILVIATVLAAFVGVRLLLPMALPKPPNLDKCGSSHDNLTAEVCAQYGRK